MKYRIFRTLLIIALATLIILTCIPFKERSTAKISTLPVLPRPIAKTPVMITSAGQNTDTYIVNDIANQLMIRSYFMPQATDADLKNMNSLVVVVGYSAIAIKLQGSSYEEEKARLEKLLKKAEENGIVIIMVALGDESNYEGKTEELLKLAGEYADYIIGIKGSSNEVVLTQLTKEKDITLTLAGEVKEISGPFASAFR